MQLTQLRFGSLALLVAALTACSGSSTQSGAVATTLGGATAVTGGSATGGKSVATGGKSSQGDTLATAGAVTTAGTSTAGGAATVAADCRQEGDNKTTLVFVNRCAQTVTYRGSDITGGALAPGAFACVDVGNAADAISSKRYWGFTGTDPGAEHYSLAEFTFNTDFYDLDWYDISYVDAFNLPLAILPAARPKCRQLICPQDFLTACPTAGQDRDSSGQLVACVSPNRDDPNDPVVQLFEQCDDAYAWSGDDQNGSDPSPMVGCQVEDFDIVFCPEAP